MLDAAEPRIQGFHHPFYLSTHPRSGLRNRGDEVTRLSAERVGRVHDRKFLSVCHSLLSFLPRMSCTRPFRSPSLTLRVPEGTKRVKEPVGGREGKEE